MVVSKSDIISRLQKEILSLGGVKTPIGMPMDNNGLSFLQHFPYGVFPTGAIHEFMCGSAEEKAVSCGFIGGLISTFLPQHGVILWISRTQAVFPHALCTFNIEPHKVIFIHPKCEKEVWWCIEEALRCNRIIAVVTEMKDLNFTNSRRFQLAVEQTKVTGFILNARPENTSTSGCTSRWKITSLPSRLADGMPGVGYPKWKVELQKIRNGKTGFWEMEWIGGQFKHTKREEIIIPMKERKTG